MRASSVVVVMDAPQVSTAGPVTFRVTGRSR
jgi:hypothetical protein